MTHARFAPSLKSLLAGPYQKLEGHRRASSSWPTPRWPPSASRCTSRWPDMLPKIEQMVRDADAGTKGVRDALTTLDAELECIARSG